MTWMFWSMQNRMCSMTTSGWREVDDHLAARVGQREQPLAAADGGDQIHVVGLDPPPGRSRRPSGHGRRSRRPATTSSDHGDVAFLYSQNLRSSRSVPRAAAEDDVSRPVAVSSAGRSRVGSVRPDHGGGQRAGSAALRPVRRPRRRSTARIAASSSSTERNSLRTSMFLPIRLILDSVSSSASTSEPASWPLTLASSVAAQTRLGDQRQLLADQLGHLAQVVRLAAGVDRERADVGVGGRGRVAGVGQAAFLADAPEQPGAHPAAERGGQHRQHGPVAGRCGRRTAPRCTGAPARCPARRPAGGAAGWSGRGCPRMPAGAAAASGGGEPVAERGPDPAQHVARGRRRRRRRRPSCRGCTGGGSTRRPGCGSSR